MKLKLNERQYYKQYGFPYELIFKFDRKLKNLNDASLDFQGEIKSL